MGDEDNTNANPPSTSTPATTSVTTTASAAIFTPIAAPVLRSVDPLRVAIFLKERERYELEVESKSLELPSLKPVLLTASIDRSLLRSLIYMGEFEDIAPGVTAKTITEEQLSKFMFSLVRRSDEGYDPTVVNNALEGLKFPVNITDARARITSYCASFFELLEAVGYEDFRDDNPKQTINLLLQRVQPSALKQKMFQRVKYERALETSVPKFINKLKSEAIACQVYGESTKPTRSTGTVSSSGTNHLSSSSVKRSGKNKNGNDGGSSRRDATPRTMRPQARIKEIRNKSILRCVSGLRTKKRDCVITSGTAKLVRMRNEKNYSRSSSTRGKKSVAQNVPLIRAPRKLPLLFCSQQNSAGAFGIRCALILAQTPI